MIRHLLLAEILLGLVAMLYFGAFAAARGVPTVPTCFVVSVAALVAFKLVLIVSMRKIS